MAFAVALIAAAPTSNDASPSPEECAQGANQGVANQCAAEDFARADAALNATYRKVIGGFKDEPTTRAKLVAAQKAWIGFRDAECALAGAAAEGGSMQPMIESLCLARLTKEREDALKRLFVCEEGDAGCFASPPK